MRWEIVPFISRRKENYLYLYIADVIRLSFILFISLFCNVILGEDLASGGMTLLSATSWVAVNIALWFVQGTGPSGLLNLCSRTSSCTDVSLTALFFYPTLDDSSLPKSDRTDNICPATFVYCVPKACMLWFPDTWKMSQVHFCTSTITVVIWWLKMRKQVLVSTFIRLSMFVGIPWHHSCVQLPQLWGLCLAVQLFPTPRHAVLGEG